MTETGATDSTQDEQQRALIAEMEKQFEAKVNEAMEKILEEVRSSNTETQKRINRLDRKIRAENPIQVANTEVSNTLQQAAAQEQIKVGTFNPDDIYGALVDPYPRSKK